MHFCTRGFLLKLTCFLLLFLSGCSNNPSADSSIFRMSIKTEPPTLDGTLATDSVSVSMITNLMEGLTQYDADLNPIPAVAKRWSYSNEGRTITFYLRDDVYWSDGGKVTAEDFEYSWKRLLAPETAAQYAYFLFDIKNASEYNSGLIKNSDERTLFIGAVGTRIQTDPKSQPETL